LVDQDAIDPDASGGDQNGKARSNGPHTVPFPDLCACLLMLRRKTCIVAACGWSSDQAVAHGFLIVASAGTICR
jgi:hypothetical protein